MRWLNERRVFESLLHGERASRAELAKITGLSAPTVGKVADRLLASGLIEEVELPSTVRASTTEHALEGLPGSLPVPGRPSRPLQLDRTRHRFVAIQIGVRHTRVAPLPVAGPLDDRWTLQFKTGRSAAAWAVRLARAARSIGLIDPWAVMVSVPGVVDEASGQVLFFPQSALDGGRLPRFSDRPRLVRPRMPGAGDSGAGPGAHDRRAAPARFPVGGFRRGSRRSGGHRWATSHRRVAFDRRVGPHTHTRQ